MPTRATAIATVTISANWTRAAVESIEATSAPVLMVVNYNGATLVLRIAIDDLAAWTGVGKKAPTDRKSLEQLVHSVVAELLKPISELPATKIEISELVVR